jgi:hypothetical protein
MGLRQRTEKNGSTFRRHKHDDRLGMSPSENAVCLFYKQETFILELVGCLQEFDIFSMTDGSEVLFSG